MPTNDRYDAESQEPISRPLKTLEEVEAWRSGCDEFCVATVPLATRVESVGGRPRTLVCHDMDGGYLDDRFIQGCSSGDAYRFYHWQYVDMFVYFSHNFITIPPPSWTNAAHKHGVPVLGTIITEWEDGRERCERFLQTEETYLGLAEKLVSIAAYYKFDGWLVNIENKIEPEKVYNLVDFVRRLTERMHLLIPNSQVVWYDSVISSGELKWQNELNDLNSGFFDACDTIFLNYTWNDDHLQRTADCASARGCLYDAYVGVDVFGRGCRGGGGYNTKEAVEVVRDYNLSVALFAQGWVYEKQGKDNFTQNENKFWSLLHDLCTPHSSVTLPFCTTFCHGQGINFYSDGQIVRPGSWTNLALQSVHPTHTNIQFKTDGEETNGDAATVPSQSIDYYTKEAFHGGGCLRLSATLTEDSPMPIYRLFDANTRVRKSLYITYTHKPICKTEANVFLDLVGRKGTKTRRLILAGRNGVPTKLLETEHISWNDEHHDSEGKTQAKRRKEEASVIECRPLSKEDVKKNLKNFEFQMQNNGWETRHFVTDDFEGFQLSQIKMGMFLPHPSEGSDSISSMVLLGKLQIMDSDTLLDVPLVTNLRIVEEDQIIHEEDIDGVSTLVISLNLRWTFPANMADHFIVYHSESLEKTTSFKMIGHSHINIFRVAKQSLGEGVRKAVFKVVPVLSSGLRPPLSKVPAVVWTATS